MNITIYKISDTKYIKINPESIGKDDCEVCAHCDIDYIDEEKNICIRFGYTETSNFCYKIADSGYIQSLIHNQMKLDNNIIDDIGFEWNQYFNGVKKKSSAFTYFFWSNDHKLIRPYYNSWLYNNEKGKVVFEITPFYPWHNETKKTCPEKISYKEWIKDYKPTVKTIIPKKNLKQWIKQAKALAEKYNLNF